MILGTALGLAAACDALSLAPRVKDRVTLQPAQDAVQTLHLRGGATLVAAQARQAAAEASTVPAAYLEEPRSARFAKVRLFARDALNILSIARDAQSLRADIVSLSKDRKCFRPEQRLSIQGCWFSILSRCIWRDQFRVIRSCADVPNGWRLATRCDVESNPRRLKQDRVLKRWLIARLEDGYCVHGRAHDPTGPTATKHDGDLGHKLLVRA